MFNHDTIAAVSTALGQGGIAVIRISGPDAVHIAQKLLRSKNLDEAGKMYLTSLIDDNGLIIDRVLAVRFQKPKSYTGEDVIEIHTHGGILIANLCLELALKSGARLAEPGEFTRRAFINGRIDLSQAEGVLSIIHAQSIESLHAAARTLTGELSQKAKKIHDDILSLQSSIEIQLDFPEGEISGYDIDSGIDNVIHELEELISQCKTGMILRNGVKVVIAGKPNAGKSSLMNALLGRKRAIVTDIPGTTRDIIEEGMIINGIPVRLIDTAGLRESEDVIESEGVKLALNAVNESDLCLYVIDNAMGISDDDIDFLNQIQNKKTIIIFNKSDIESKIIDMDSRYHKISVSAKTLTNITELKHLIYESVIDDSVLSQGLNVSSGQLDEMNKCLEALKEAKFFVSEDITAGLLNSARLGIMRVLGLDAGDELLDSMFSRFCVGK